MPCVYITGGSNKPSGGVKVMNQIAVLFEDHGFESYVVPADGSGEATFLDRPAKTTTVQNYAQQLKEDDVTIDFWPNKQLVEIAAQKKNKTRIFWQHGASIPVGGSTVGDVVFQPGNPYTQHWNVSRACAQYFRQRYRLDMPIVYPFFDSPTMREFQTKSDRARNGCLLLARRGQHYLPAIQKRFSEREQITILKEPYHERDFFQALCQHKFFISTDDGIHKPSVKRQVKNALRWILSREVRKKSTQTNQWIIPEGHLLGFPMPPVEAAWLGCVVIGFAMGGGLEWMNKANCFLAKDADESSLLCMIEWALHTSEDELREIRQQAQRDTSRFTSENTWKQLTGLLNL